VRARNPPRARRGPPLKRLLVPALRGYWGRTVAVVVAKFDPGFAFTLPRGQSSRYAARRESQYVCPERREEANCNRVSSPPGRGTAAGLRASG
jgi:hypothetical protein